MKKQFQKGNIVIKFVALFVLTAILITGFFYQFYNKLEQALKNQAQTYLNANADQAVNSLDKNMSTMFGKLESLADYLAQKEILTEGTLQDLYNRQNSIGPFYKLAVNMADGESYYNDDFFRTVTNQDYFKEAMKGETSVSKIQVSPTDKLSYIILAVPIHKSGKVVGVLQCACQRDMLIDFLSPATFNGNGRVALIQKDGKVLVGTLHIKTGENFYDTVIQATSLEGVTKELLPSKILNGESGLFEYSYQNETDYISYLPAYRNDWYIISVVPTNYIKSQSEQISSYVLFMMFEISAVFILMVLIIIIVQRRNQKRLSDSKQEFETLAANIPGGVLRLSADENQTLDFISEGCLRLFGYTQEQFMNKCQNKLENIIYQKDRSHAMESILSQTMNHHHVKTEFRIVDADGRLKWMLYRGRVIRNSSGEKWQYVVLMDITHIKKTQEELRQSMERYRIVTEQMDCVIYEYNLLDDTIYVSSNFNKIFGYEIPKYRFPASLKENDVIHPDDMGIAVEHYRRIHSGAPGGEIELRIRKSDDTYLWCKIQTTTLFDNLGTPVKSIAKITDINAEKAATQRLLDQAQHDCLTGIYNKSTGISLIDRYLKTDNGSSICALYVLDVDYFKKANDTYGHLFGDEVLIEVSSKVKTLFRASDVICRIGGDESVIFLKNVSDLTTIEAKAREICQAFHNTVFYTHSDFHVSVSIGIASGPKDGKNYLELFKKADLALYHTKKNGKDGYTVYQDGEMNTRHPIPPKEF